MNELNIFAYEENMVRTRLDEQGDIWFVAKDVCTVLGLENPTVAVAALDEDERAKFNLGRQGEANIISESGLYALAFRSRKPEAKAFSKWVRAEVLPSLRKTGSYSLGKPAKPSASAEEFIVCSPLAKKLPLPLRKRCLELAVSTHIKTGIDADTLFNTFCAIFYEEEQEGIEQEEQPSDSELLLMRDFYAETCKPAPDFRIRSLVLFKAYGIWYEQKFGMVSCMSHKNFSMLSRKTGLVRRVSINPYSLFCGMALQADYAAAYHE